MHEKKNDHIKLPAKIENPEKTKEIFNLNKTRTEKATEEYTFRTCRLINRLNQKIEFRQNARLTAMTDTDVMEVFRRSILRTEQVHIGLLL